MAPLSGGQEDTATMAAAAVLAEPFGAEVVGVFTPVDAADVMPWMGEDFMGGVQASALETLEHATAVGERRARMALEACAYANLRFVSLQSPVWAGLCAEGRLSDVVVFLDNTARGRGALADHFQQMIAGEQRPVLIVRPGFKAADCVMVAWDGGKEASRAARLATPLLEKAGRVIIVSAPEASSRRFDPANLQAYYGQRGVRAEVELLSNSGDVAHALLEATHRAGADILVAGAYGHPRLQEFIFGGTTRTLLNSDGPSLFLSH
jgi:nucleotide-binding universal stress UspA family protein